MTVLKKNTDLRVQCNNCTLTIKYPEVTYSYWKNLIPFNDDFDLIDILDGILDSLDCSFEYDCKRVLMTTHMNYDSRISSYYYYLLHLTNQLDYNYAFDQLIKIHEDNIDFERNNPVIVQDIKSKAKPAAKTKSKSKFVRQVTKDMFTNEETYIYSNSKTGEVINSSDPNLLDSLNGVKVKVKKVKSAGVPMSSMTFSFKKKQND